jgi:hypothetical protein
MINVSFYLSAPKAKNFSSLYVSITSARERLRFPTGEKLPAQYCNLRKKKGKDLLKKNTTFYLELDKKLSDLRMLFFQIAFDLEKRLHRIARPEEIKEEYLNRTKSHHLQYDEAVMMPLFAKFISSGAIVNANSSSSMSFFTNLETPNPELLFDFTYNGKLYHIKQQSVVDLPEDVADHLNDLSTPVYADVLDKETGEMVSRKISERKRFSLTPVREKIKGESKRP